MIVADGLVIVPEGSSGCSCSYNYQTSLALVHSAGKSDTWFMFASEGLKDEKLVRRLSVNFGAPGDNRDRNGERWLASPRPNAPGTYRLPVNIVMDSYRTIYRPGVLTPVSATGTPWLFTSALSGKGRIIIDLSLDSNLFIPRCTTAPKIDGALDDPCWKDAKPVKFDGRRNLLNPRTTLYISRDERNIYFAYRREAARQDGNFTPFVAEHPGREDAQCWLDDDFEIFITDAAKKTSLQFGVSCAGGRFDGVRDMKNRWRRADLKWNGQWLYAVKRTPGEWLAEIAIPLDTLRKAKLNVAKLLLNGRARNLSGTGPESIYLKKPDAFGFDRCRVFLPLADKAQELPVRSFTVRMYFAELESIRPGSRVFSIYLQGKPVLRKFDIVRVAGRPGRALVREFRHVKAKETIEIQLRARDNASLPPLVSAVQVSEEK